METEYPYFISITLVNITASPIYPFYYAKTFEDAYKFAMEKGEKIFREMGMEIDVVHSEKNIFLNNKFPCNPYFCNNLEEAKENGKVWKTPNLGISYYCNIFQPNSLNFYSLFQSNIVYKLRRHPNTLFKMHYFAIIQENENVIYIDFNKSSHIAHNPAKKYFMDFEAGSLAKRDPSLKRIISQFFCRNSIPKIKSMDCFMDYLRNNENFYLSNEDFENENKKKILHQKLKIIFYNTLSADFR